MENSRIDTRLIQQYLEGKLEPGRMHQLEKEALNDPFLADALEGYSYAKKPMDHQLSILQRQLEQRIAIQQENKNRFNYSWQRLSIAAAAGLIFITASLLFWMRFQPAREFSGNLNTVSQTIYPKLTSSGSEDFYLKYLKNNLKRPGGAPSGKVQIGFTIHTNGTLSNFKVLKGLTDSCNMEAIRLIKDGPAWKPEKKNKNVTISVDFAKQAQ